MVWPFKERKVGIWPFKQRKYDRCHRLRTEKLIDVIVSGKKIWSVWSSEERKADRCDYFKKDNLIGVIISGKKSWRPDPRMISSRIGSEVIKKEILNLNLERAGGAAPLRNCWKRIWLPSKPIEPHSNLETSISALKTIEKTFVDWKSCTPIDDASIFSHRNKWPIIRLNASARLKNPIPNASPSGQPRTSSQQPISTSCV
jgi:hypothetical protein